MFELGYWPSFVLHDVINWRLGRPISSSELEAGLLALIGDSYTAQGFGKILMGLDPTIRWVLNGVPLTLWLILVVPLIWFLSWNYLMFGLPKRATDRQGDDNLPRHRGRLLGRMALW